MDLMLWALRRRAFESGRSQLEGAMGLVARIAHKLGLTILTRGDIELVDLRAAQRILDACRQERVTVLGIEGFHVRGSQTVPDMNAIADFSAAAGLPWSERVERSVTDAKAFLGSVSDRGLLFDLTLALEGEAGTPARS